ncbi:TIGR03619 family F420-dependent LLM class oxidoreductase [Actinomadura barringtoniae]|uniref:TIGR03619 family F420-dependent LLM class oxidoreductase n=1 Tax=Actinomadura barringtoniae TaxID=1427535 RepID=A0A939PPX2_9ACTN|nr:TIGR03619 family F420-dependent LLM class oxidoreductase [Actinomadura barringtoniae]MBO2453974.1 TIGR03619 family F420-dependent LLM class oxidoreductase [Actinomadura barringtoniae]
MTAMKLGVHLPVAGADASPESIASIAQDAERLGLDSVWTWDRLMRPTVPIAMGGPGGPVMEAPEMFGSVYDPLETLSYVAAVTNRISLGTSVLDSLFQSPVVLARRLATLDRLSGGRLIAGIGQGWMEQEFDAAGVSMRRRGAGYEEHTRAMQAVWGPDPVSFDGRFYTIPEADIGPKPVRPGGPTLIAGAGSPAGIERAARLGAGLTLVIFDWDTIRATIEAFRTAAAAEGHAPAALPIMLQVNGAVTAKPLDERGPLTGSVEQVAADLETAAEMGVEHVFWNTAGAGEPGDQLPLIAQLRRI